MNKFTESFVATQAYFTALVMGLHARKDERGVVSIEYLVLGGALVVLIGALAQASGVTEALSNAFIELFGG